jgi:serine/threonine-protein kinase HipA
MNRLRVWANARPMGWLRNEGGVYHFKYDTEWLENSGGFVLAPQFPLETKEFSGYFVREFFQNLLPEGDALEAVEQQLKVRSASTYETIGLLGNELPGVLSVLPEGVEKGTRQTYQPLEFDELSRRIKNRDRVPLLLSNAQGRMSLAGAQDKFSARFDKKTHVLRESTEGSPTTHILKPDMRVRTVEDGRNLYEYSTINEFSCMKLAKLLGMVVPDVWLLRVPEPVYLIERYDRKVVSGNIVPLHQIDGCQFLGQSGGDWKYETDGELVSLRKLANGFRTVRVPAKDMLQFQRWVMFNYLIGNSDAHAKNISVLIDYKRFSIAPFYDLICERVYIVRGLALYIGGEKEFDQVGRHSWEAFCKDCDFRLPEFLKEFRNMATKLLPAWGKVGAEIEKKNTPTESEKALLVRMTAVFEKQVQNAMSMTEKLS